MIHTIKNFLRRHLRMTTPTPTPVEPLERQDIRTLEAKGRRAVEKITHRLTQLTVDYVPIDSIFPNPYNPNRQTEREFELLKKSILEDGFTQPIVVQKSSKMIVDGEHRWRAINQLGFHHAPVVFVDMTEEQMRISTLRHNRARGSEDIELSIQVLRDLRELGALDKAIESLQIDDVTLQALLDDIPAPDLMAQEDFSTAWIPATTKGAYEPEQVIADRRISTSDSAQELLQKFDGQLDETNSHLEMGRINQEAHLQVNQVSATFKKEEAALVRSVLGQRPAQKLIELCVKIILAEKDKYDPYIVECALRARGKWKKQ